MGYVRLDLCDLDRVFSPFRSGTNPLRQGKGPAVDNSKHTNSRGAVTFFQSSVVSPVRTRPTYPPLVDRAGTKERGSRSSETKGFLRLHLDYHQDREGCGVSLSDTGGQR